MAEPVCYAQDHRRREHQGACRRNTWFWPWGVVFGLVLVGAAMIPDEVWEREGEAGAVIAHAAGIANTANPALLRPHVPVVPADVAPEGADFPFASAAVPQTVAGTPPNPDNGWRRNGAPKGLIPFTRAVTQKYSGKVVSVAALGGDIGWGQVHVWMNDIAGQVQQMSLAPDWYMAYLGCAITENTSISGAAFRFDLAASSGMLYAKTVIVNGLECRLRNDEGFAFQPAPMKGGRWKGRLGRGLPILLAIVLGAGVLWQNTGNTFFGVARHFSGRVIEGQFTGRLAGPVEPSFLETVRRLFSVETPYRLITIRHIPQIAQGAVMPHPFVGACKNCHLYEGGPGPGSQFKTPVGAVLEEMSRVKKLGPPLLATS